jgi:hypothetical protein
MSLAFSKKTSCAFNTFIQSLPSAGHFLALWKGTKIITVPKVGKDIKFLPNLRPISHYGQIISEAGLRKNTKSH